MSQSNKIYKFHLLVLTITLVSLVDHANSGSPFDLGNFFSGSYSGKFPFGGSGDKKDEQTDDDSREDDITTTSKSRTTTKMSFKGNELDKKEVAIVLQNPTTKELIKVNTSSIVTSPPGKNTSSGGENATGQAGRLAMTNTTALSNSTTLKPETTTTPESPTEKPNTQQLGRVIRKQIKNGSGPPPKQDEFLSLLKKLASSSEEDGGEKKRKKAAKKAAAGRALMGFVTTQKPVNSSETKTIDNNKTTEGKSGAAEMTISSNSTNLKNTTASNESTPTAVSVPEKMKNKTATLEMTTAEPQDSDIPTSVSPITTEKPNTQFLGRVIRKPIKGAATPKKQDNFLALLKKLASSSEEDSDEKPKKKKKT